MEKKIFKILKVNGLSIPFTKLVKHDCFYRYDIYRNSDFIGMITLSNNQKIKYLDTFDSGSHKSISFTF